MRVVYQALPALPRSALIAFAPGSLWRRRCSLAVALSSCSRRNLSLALIGVELHSEESSVEFSTVDPSVWS